VDENMLADPAALYPLHVPPERFKAAKLGPEADIYQAGLTLYRMFNGDALFFEPIGGRKGPEEIQDQKIRNKVNDKIRKGAFPARDAYLPHVPKRLRAAILKALDPDPNARFKAAAELIESLGDVDQALDWEFEQGPERCVWRREGDTAALRIELAGPDAKGRQHVETTRTGRESGVTQRSIKHCKICASVAEAHRFVATVAAELG
jgi:serine/threonine protein kinase